MIETKAYAVWDNQRKEIVRIGKFTFHETSAPVMTKVNNLNRDAGSLRYSVGTFSLSLEKLRQKSLPRPE